MQSILRARVPLSRCQPLASRFQSRTLGTYATFKIPQINNEPNVSSQPYQDAKQLRQLIDFP